MQSAKLFNPDISDMRHNAIRLHGNVKKLAEHYNVSRDTMYEYFKRNPETRKLVDDLRNYNTESDLDAAEDVIRMALESFKTKPGIALRAAERVLDGKGHSRHWNVPYQMGNKIDTTHIDNDDEKIRDKAEIAKLRTQLAKYADK